MALSRIEALKWIGVFGRAFERATAPYYRVNVFDVRAEYLEAVIANAGVQKELAREIGAVPESWSERQSGELVRVVWIMSYPSGVNSNGSGAMAIWRMRSFFPTWFEFCRLIESYDWSLTNEIPPSREG